jgi:hypothetical protein
MYCYFLSYTHGNLDKSCVRKVYGPYGVWSVRRWSLRCMLITSNSPYSVCSLRRWSLRRMVPTLNSTYSEWSQRHNYHRYNKLGPSTYGPCFVRTIDIQTILRKDHRRTNHTPMVLAAYGSYVDGPYGVWFVRRWS